VVIGRMWRWRGGLTVEKLGGRWRSVTDLTVGCGGRWSLQLLGIW
jgi:hypothetical protein